MESKKFINTYKHIRGLLRELSKGREKFWSVIAPAKGAWKDCEKTFILCCDDDCDDKTYDNFYTAIKEYPWETYGIAKPRVSNAGISPAMT